MPLPSSPYWMASHDVAISICRVPLDGGGGSVSFGRAPAASPFGRVGSGQSGQGLTLTNFSAQPESFCDANRTLNTP